MSGKLILVTGATGFIAGHVVSQLLEKGYKVRGTTRGSKAKLLNETVNIPGLEFAQVDDVATSDLTEALEGVHAVIHVASPMPGRSDVDDVLNSAIEGTLNVLRQVAAAGIEKIVITSSASVLLDPFSTNVFDGRILNSKSQLSEVTREQAYERRDHTWFVYMTSKSLAEKAVWKFAAEHPEIDVATILPSYIYGPYAYPFSFPSSPAGLGMNSSILELMDGTHPMQFPPAFVDVRDAAKAHVLALDLPRKPLEEKRFLVCSKNYTWKEAAEYLGRVRPEMKIAAPETFSDLPGPPPIVDTTRAEEVLKIGTWIAPERTLLDSIDSLVEVKKTWVA